LYNFSKFCQILKSIEIRKEFLFEFWPGSRFSPVTARLSFHPGQPTPLSPPWALACRLAQTDTTRPHRRPSSFFTVPSHSFLGCRLPSSAHLAHVRPWCISGNMFSLSGGTYHGTRRPFSSSSHTEPERASRHRQPASRRPHGRPRPPPLKRKRHCVASSFIPPLNGSPSALKYSSNRRLQVEVLTPAVTRVPRLCAPSLSPINRPPRPHRSPHLPHLSFPLF
jgi:hypothetical protein